MDDVNHPKHYKGKTLESIDVIEDFSLNFQLGNAIKYILRCNNKGHKIKDLQKAIWYLQREIENTHNVNMAS
jgi:hypothetical protein